MKIKLINSYSYSFIVLIFLFSCNPQCKVENIEVSELLMVSSTDKKYNYCELLEKSIKKDEPSIKEISLLNFDNAVCYDHGSILVDLINNIGEEKYIKALKELNIKEKNKVKSYLKVGLLYYENKKYKDKSFKEVFPKVYTFVSN